MKFSIRQFQTGPRRVWAGTTLVALLLAVGACAIDRPIRQEIAARARTQVSLALAPKAGALQAALERRRALLRGLDASLTTQTEPDEIEREFAACSSRIAGGAPGIRALEAAPGGKIAAAYPAFQSTLPRGWDLLNDPRPAVRAASRRAWTTDQDVISDPFRLYRGGVGVVMRRTVRQHGRRWGLAILVQDFPTLVKEAGLTRPDGLEIALTGRQGRVLTGHGAALEEDPVSVPVTLSEGRTWTLSAAPRGGWDAATAPLLARCYGLEAALATLLLLIAALALGRQTSLADSVQRRTADLARSREDLHLALEAAKMGAWECDQSGAIRWSEGMDAVHGIEGGIGGNLRSYLRLIHPEDRQGVMKALSHSLATGEDYRKEFRVLTPDGGLRWIEGRGRVFRDAAGTTRRMAGTAQDITDRRLREQARRDSEEAFRRVFEESPYPLALTDADGRFLDVNAALIAMTGYPAERLQGNNGQDLSLMPAEDHDRIVAGMQTDGRVSGLEVTVFCAEDRRRIGLLTCLPLQTGNGSLLLNLMEDVTERRAQEAALIAKTAETEAILASITDAFFAVDQDWRITYLNPAAERHLGPREDVLGCVLWERYCGLLGTVFEEEYRRAAATQTTAAFEAPFEPLGIWAEVRAYPSAQGLSVYYRDVTAEKAAEAKIAKTASLLASTLEATADGIFAIDAMGRIDAYNTKFFDLWQIPEEYRAYDIFDARVMEWTLSQVADPAALGERLARQTAQPDLAETYPLEFADGRVFECCSQPRRQNGEIVGRVWSFRDVTDRRLFEEELTHQAFHDSLTGLPNRALLHERVERSLAAAARHRRQAAVLFLDLDGFKHVNDTLGHAVGDGLLRAIAARLSGCLREEDTLARMGGDEFAVLISDLNAAEDAVRVAEKLLAAVARPVPHDGRELFVTGSIGVSLYPHDGLDAETLLRCADAAMYRAKSDGRGACRLYTSELNAAAFERLFLESGLRQAIERGELELFYQPQIDAATGAPLGAEALVRWRHPEMGLISPARFIPLAEETGLIVPVGAWVLETACREAARRLSAGTPLRIGVNVSARQFERPEFVETVARALAETGLPGGLLDLELTESALARDPETAEKTLHALKGLGVSLSVDDFGTGYSSLASLRRLPLDILKADRSLVSGLPEDRVGAAILRAAVDMAHALGLSVIAEGVETEIQRDAVAALGCDSWQGYLCSPPVPADRLDSLLTPVPPALKLAA